MGEKHSRLIASYLGAMVRRINEFWFVTAKLPPVQKGLVCS